MTLYVLSFKVKMKIWTRLQLRLHNKRWILVVFFFKTLSIIILIFYSAIQENSLLVDSSTIDPAASQEMAAIASEKDSSYVDAPVSGGL